MKKEAHAMGCQLTKSALNERTQEYWDKKPGYDCYINELLGRELQHAASQPDGATRLRGVGKPVHTLAFTVGESFEPLLQVVCVLRPKRVVLILNRHYGVARNRVSGSVQGKKLQDLIKQLHKVADIPDDIRPALIDDEKIVPRVLKQDTPTCVFRVLHEEMQKLEAQPSEAQPSEDLTNVVDITGAKKSMVVGAFLYAAHSGLPITYVDFDEYDTQRGKPYGYTCRIGEIANPYEAFHLRDWEQVRRLYTSYNFREAYQLLEGVTHAMSCAIEGDGAGEKLFEDTDTEKVRNLGVALQMYEAWDSGNFRRAANYSTSIPCDELPSAVTVLGKNWFEVTSSGVSGGPTDFYADHQSLEVYAVDEISRIGRLIHHNQDYRSAFLRAGGLNEVILTARLVSQIQDEGLRQKLLDALKTKVPNGRRLFLELGKNSGDPIRMDKLGLEGDWPEKPPLAQRINTWWRRATGFANDDGWERFLELRNILAHRYVSVEREMSEHALSFVTANFEDFFGYPPSKSQWNVAAVSWSRACELFELGFLPPQLRTNI
jgi:hypothetical protein